MKEARIEVYGRVQGIGFRNSVKNFAEQNGLTGTAMNLSNGSVLVVVQGKENLIKETVAWLDESPGFSKVEVVDVQWSEPIKPYEEFKITRDGNFFSDKLKALKNLFNRLFVYNGKIEHVPKHLAIIPDGNRRWAQYRRVASHFGHYKSGSYVNLKMLFREATNLGVECVSIWGFSTENWKRDAEERKAIFDLVLGRINSFLKDAHENKIKFKHIGRKDRLSKDLVKAMEKLERETKDYNKFTVQLCLDYGGRDEIVRAVNKILKEGKKEINEEEFRSYLDGSDVGDPDLVIRTSGERRTSGFMPFQAAYAEWYFSDLYFPEFGAVELRKAVREYSKRVRRFGGA